MCRKCGIIFVVELSLYHIFGTALTMAATIVKAFSFYPSSVPISHRIFICAGYKSTCGRRFPVQRNPPACPTHFQPAALRLVPGSVSSLCFCSTKAFASRKVMGTISSAIVPTSAAENPPRSDRSSNAAQSPAAFPALLPSWSLRPGGRPGLSVFPLRP